MLEWRQQRDNAYLIHSSLVPVGSRVDKLNYLPLPFDDELVEEGIEDMKELREQADANLYYATIQKWKDEEKLRDAG